MIATAIATHAPRDIVNRHAKHMQNVVSHATTFCEGFSA